MTFLIYKQNDKFEEMFRRIREDWASEKYDEEMKIKESYAQTGTVITKYITLTGCVSGFFFVFTTCFLTKILDLIIPLNQSRPLILPFNDDYFIDQEKYYYLILIHANLTVLVIITFFVANETIFCVHIHHIYGMLAVLGYRLEFIIPNLKLDSKNQTNPYYDSISWCIQCHQETLDYFSNWQNFSPRTQRLLLLFIKRCERPCSISAFSLYLMSLNSFRTVTQTGFSYFMVLKQLR
ncbi:uncharacterized protein [Prorops nasuta]|uniref:uncharacterized protein isoform X1 n=1 Tax=Prorops nasuta TaxID=863751 RepID=UPI0034CDEC09